MYNASVFKSPDIDWRWFHKEVSKFNAIGNPEGINEVNQIMLVLEEVGETLHSNTEQDFIDGLVDILVVAAPLADEENFLCNSIEDVTYKNFEHNLKWFTDLPEGWSIKGEIKVFLLSETLQLLNKYGARGKIFAYSVLESNLSKFIPVKEYKVEHLEQVKGKYKGVEVTMVKRCYEGEEYFVFYNAKTGKILKGHDYFKEPMQVSF